MNYRLDDEESLVSTWAVIEAKRTLPATIAVVGATDLDDTVAVARGLARAAVLGGRRTGYLSLTGGASRDVYDVLVLPTATGAAYYERARDWRTQYEVLIVEVPRVLASTVGAQMTRSADGVIVALRGDRNIVERDRRLSAFLAQLGAKTIGVVTTNPKGMLRDAPATRITLKGVGRTLRSLVFRT